VNLHQGTITVHSEGLGKGTTFVVTLPVVKQIPNSVVQDDQTIRRISCEEDSENNFESVNIVPLFGGLDIRHVLVVDDAASNRKMITRILRNCGCVCSEASDGLECLQLVNNTMNDLESDSKFQMILMDSEMPG
jgi:PleD family two-component response regulator